MREGEPWSDEELSIAVETYRFLLRLERNGYRCSENDLAQLLRNGPLGRRRQSSLRYRMRNISAILADRDLPILQAYSPAPRAGTQVRARLEAMLFAETLTNQFLGRDGSGTSDDQRSPSDVLADAAKALRAALDELERVQREIPGIGHNRPPEALNAPTSEDLRDAILALETSRAELSAARLTKETARENANLLARFGLRAAAWTGERLTKATDAGLDAGARLSARFLVVLFFALPSLAAAIGILIRLAG